MFFIDEQGTSIVSDIDDTIKITAVNNPEEMVKNTFKRPFKEVPGMPQLYRKWQAELTDSSKNEFPSFHYLSGSMYQLYEPIAAFFKSVGFPDGLFEMQFFNPRPVKDIHKFADVVAHKTTELNQLFQDFPKRSFILIGDSTQSDPEV